MDDLVYLVYFLGFLSTDGNSLLQIGKQMRLNFVTILLRWTGDLEYTEEHDKGDTTSLYLLHFTAYIAYMVFTVVLLMYTLFPNQLKMCKNRRFFLLSEHILFSGVCDFLLQMTIHRGEHVIRESSIIQIPTNVISFLLRILGVGFDTGNQVFEWLLPLTFAIALMKVFVGMFVCFRVCDAFECGYCKENEGCRAPPYPPFHCHNPAHGHSHSYVCSNQGTEMKIMNKSKTSSNSKKHR